MSPIYIKDSNDLIYPKTLKPVLPFQTRIQIYWSAVEPDGQVLAAEQARVLASHRRLRVHSEHVGTRSFI